MKAIVAILLFCMACQAVEKPRHDKVFWSVVAVQTGLMLWDETQTVGCLHNVPNCRETNPLYGPHPSAARLYVSAALVGAGYALASYEMQRHAPRTLRRLWWTAAAFDAACHAEGIATSVHGSTPDKPIIFHRK